ncbi:MAG: ATP-grasp domain-containing protein [Aquidulcibacter sp.]|jgi:predicted ATP-grasp superfamily ATP-dependent carboligase|uniref:ATP-grasp domain-containing protein n=1 Tax=Aquidulcibacter sp. TaxID=2052990 RepID=UPI0022BCB929|nr:ATP-grasp domain-containing protein [Aquidulcibacter sp.]MCE2891689.1 ATP-grasp domain-containing protein [Hyphomonadaceae bacterium]MCZ8209087.1 ATP-grasp domain-containing protein [Aquidulcibacter sp.]
MSQTVLITIGRLPKALDFARSFKAAGWRVLVAEPFKSHLTGASKCVDRSFQVPPPSKGKEAYLAALLRLIEAEGVDLVLPLSEETMHVAHLAGRLPARTRLYAPPVDRLLALHDKARFPAIAQTHGLTVPETALIESPEAQAIAEHQDFVVKPIFSCSGRAVSLHTAGTSLIDVAANLTEPAVVQVQVKGKQYSTFAMAQDGKVLINVTYQGAVMTGSVAVAFERVEIPAIQAWVETFVSRENHSGFISFDFFVDESGTASAIECNPRVTSGVHFIETDDLAPAILNPGAQPIRFKQTKLMQQFYPTLTEVQAAMFKGPHYWDRLKVLRTAQDVTWDARDPMPFITMPITAFSIIALSMRQQQTFGQVSTQDITWFEGERLEAF